MGLKVLRDKIITLRLPLGVLAAFRDRQRTDPTGSVALLHQERVTSDIVRNESCRYDTVAGLLHENCIHCTTSVHPY
jgi:hypothetical protein